MSSTPPLADLRFALVGPGRVGWSLTRWAQDRGARLVAVVGRNKEHARDGASLPLDGLWCPLSELSSSRGRLEDADLLLIAVADGAITEVASHLANALAAPTAAAPRIALHTSGIHDAEGLAPLRDAGFAVGSLHPLMAFPRPLDTPTPRPPLCAVDGDDTALELAHRLAEAFGGRGFAIAGDARLLYHLAATVAAGGVATLLAVVERLLERSGLPAELLPAYFDLARGALEHAAATRPVTDAITGPAARGDHATVARQLAALEAVAPELHAVIAGVHGETTRLRRETGAEAPDEALDSLAERSTSVDRPGGAC
ncbi:MAG: DUF2520 domain-containing protein [Acidobacteriota bacterium]